MGDQSLLINPENNSQHFSVLPQVNKYIYINHRNFAKTSLVFSDPLKSPLKTRNKIFLNPKFDHSNRVERTNNTNIHINPNLDLSNIHINPHLIKCVVNKNIKTDKTVSNFIMTTDKDNLSMSINGLIKESSKSGITKFENNKLLENCLDVPEKHIVYTKYKIIKSKNDIEKNNQSTSSIANIPAKNVCTKYKIMKSKNNIQNNNQNASSIANISSAKMSRILNKTELPKLVKKNVVQTTYKIIKKKNNGHKARELIENKNITLAKLAILKKDSYVLPKIQNKNMLRTKYKYIKNSNPMENYNRISGKNVASINITMKAKDLVPETKVYFQETKKHIYTNNNSIKNRKIFNASIGQKKFVNPKKYKLINKSFCQTKYICHKRSESFSRENSLSISNKPVTSKYKFIKKSIKSYEIKPHLVNKYKLITISGLMQGRIAPSKLRKNNMSCPIFRRFGKCNGKDNGTCIKTHNPDQVTLCTRFLQGACLKKNCLLSHKVSKEKMPTCKYYLDGLCSRDDCQYLHVKINPKMNICKEFVEGFCEKAGKCEKRHQFLCPDFESSGKCKTIRCPYPHGKLVRTKLIMHAKKCFKESKNISKRIETAQKSAEKVQNHRYYCDEQNVNDVSNQLSSNSNRTAPSRPKVGILPSFIPFFDEKIVLD